MQAVGEVSPGAQRRLSLGGGAWVLLGQPHFGPVLKMPPTGIHSYTALAKFLKEIVDKAKQCSRSLLGLEKPKM